MKLGHWLVTSALVSVVSLARAEDFFGAVQTEGDSEDIGSADRVSEDDSTGSSSWVYRGWLQQQAAYGYRTPPAGFSRDQASLTRTETELYGELDWKSAHWRLRLAGSIVHDWLPQWSSAYSFSEEQEKARRWHFEVADSYVSWQDGDWWIKGGYQTLAWGEAESLKVIDVLSRRDQRWPGQEDLQNTRLPVPAVLFNWRNALDLVLLFKTPTDRRPVAYEEFDPYISLRSGDSRADPSLHHRRGERPGWALRWQQRWRGVDAQFMIADVYSFETAPRAFVLEHNEANSQANSPLNNDDLPRLGNVELSPWRQQVVGLGVQAVRGNWLFRSEQAWHRRVRLPLDDALAPWAERDQWRGMAGADYNGFHNLSLSGELSWQYTSNWKRDLERDREETGAAIRARYTLLNQSLNLEGFVLRLNENGGNLLRLSADWDWSDQLGLSLTLVEYSADREQLIYPYRHNDTLLLGMTWGW